MTSIEFNELNKKYIDSLIFLDRKALEFYDLKGDSSDKLGNAIRIEMKELIETGPLYRDAHDIALTVDPNCLPRFGIG